MRNLTLVMTAACVASWLTACSAPLPPASQAERASAISVAVAAPVATPPSDFGSYATALSVFGDPAGQWSNFAANGVVPPTNPFFLALGSNKRTCGTCHNPNNGWTESPTNLNNRFTASNGNDPIFASIDGTNCPSLSTATLAAHRTASSLLLTKGLIRIGLTPPNGAEFLVLAVNNPYGCTSQSQISVYRRISPTTNLGFLSNVMWDGRESLTTSSVQQALLTQASDAVTGHEAGAVAPTAATLSAIYNAEIPQFSAQTTLSTAGALNGTNAQGGVLTLPQQSFTPGSNNPFSGKAPIGVTPSPAFTLFSAWESLSGGNSALLARASVGRGEKLFNSLPITLTGVAGLNDQVLNGKVLTTVTGTCATCHNAPNAGSHTTSFLVNTGVAAANVRTSDLPLITLSNRATGGTVQTSDPGLALTTGKWADIGKFKVPVLRNLSARAPYFHNGSAATLDDVVNFYNARFAMKLTAQQHADLVAFLSAL